MTDKNQTNLEGRLRALSTNFNHQDRAYAILSGVAEKGTLPEIEEQLAIMKANVGKRILSVQLLLDYVKEGITMDKKPSFYSLGPLHVDPRCGVNTDGKVSCSPSLNSYDGYQEFEKSDYNK